MVWVVLMMSRFSFKRFRVTSLFIFFFLISSLSLITISAFAQRKVPQRAVRITITGRVLDDATGDPLEDVNVFLANTMMGAATNANGEFTIRGVPAGTFDLVVSRLGYRVDTRHLIISEENRDRLAIRMIPRPYQAPEIEVTAKEIRKWHKNYLKFRRLFFSNTENAGDCRILNPNVLEFQRRKGGVFSASAAEPLQIVNRALGYRIYYVLEIFTASRTVITMRGFSKFAEMVPHTPEEERRWQKNRKRAYRGSLKHFLATLSESRRIESFSDKSENKFLAQAGFRVFHVKEPWGTRNKTRLHSLDEILKPLPSRKEGRLSFPDYLMVNYFKESPPEDYYNFGDKFGYPNKQISLIKLTADSVLVDPMGNICDDHGMRVDGFGIRTYGYWSWKRMADRLPWDYGYPQRRKIL